MRDRLGTEAAAYWFEKQGINFELAMVALMGSEKARKYGVHMGHICSPKWKHAEW